MVLAKIILGPSSIVHVMQIMQILVLTVQQVWQSKADYLDLIKGGMSAALQG